MLKKLYKHEFYSLFRNLWPIYIALLGLAGISRISYLFSAKNNVFLGIFQGSSTTLYCLSIFALFITSLIIVITRFYKNLLSHEGYLTFTLPVTATQHITCKLVCGVTVMLMNLIAVFLSLLILALQPGIFEVILQGIKEAWQAIIQSTSTANVVLIIAEFIIFGIVAMTTSLLMFYVSLAIGQQFKNRIAAAVVAYICIYYSLQMINTIILMPIMIANADFMDNIFINYGVSALQIVFGAVILYQLILGIVYFIVTRTFLTKKLNLE